MKTHIQTLLLLFSFATLTNAANYYVSPDGDDGDLGTAQAPKATIQAAIDIAINGDTIYLLDGIYSGPGNQDISFNGTNLTVKSYSGPTNCIIDIDAQALDPHRAFIFQNNETDSAIIDGLTIINGYSSGSGGAIRCQNASPTIQNCLIHNNTANDGGALYFTQSDSLIQNCIITNNIANGTGLNGNGGAIYTENNADIIIDRCTITSNTCNRFGGALFCDLGTLLTTNTLFSENISASMGGAIYSSESVNFITNCTIADNQAEYNGGAIKAHYYNDTTISNSILDNNTIVDAIGIGPEISLTQTTTLEVTHTCIETGQTNIAYEQDCVVLWLDTNIEKSPYFTDGSFVHNNGTPSDDSDDFTVNDYPLFFNSPCIDAGDNDAISLFNQYDIEGNTRINNSTVDLGAYESNYQFRTIDITSCKAKAGKTRQDIKDAFAAKGTIDITENELLDAETITINLWAGDELIYPLNINMAEQEVKKGKMKYKGLPGKTSIKLDSNKQTFSLSAKYVDLTGLKAPLNLEIEAGNYYGLTSIDETILNGSKKYADLKFLSGHSNALRISKFKYKEGKELYSNKDSLVIKGEFSVDDPTYELWEQEVSITWGTYEAIIPAGEGGLFPVKTKYIYKKPKDLEPPVGTNYIDAALFDMVKCTFQIVIKKANIAPQTSPVTFSLTMPNYYETETVTFD